MNNIIIPLDSPQHNIFAILFVLPENGQKAIQQSTRKGEQMQIKDITRLLVPGNLWRFIVSLVDWRTCIRKVTGHPAVDAVFISNMRDDTDRITFNGDWHPQSGHFAGPRYIMGNINARVRAIDSITADLLSSQGRKRAKDQFIAAVQWAENRGAQVALLAASTKRLFGEDGKTLKTQFPNIVFTIGDNGTTCLLLQEISYALTKAGLNSVISRIGVLGPYGILGRQVTEALVDKGYNVVGAGPNAAALKGLAQELPIETCTSFQDMGKVDAVICCTHSDKIRLTAGHVDIIRYDGKKLLVVDVAEPSNLTKEEYERCRKVVIRQDAGNAYNPKLKYVLGALSYRMFRLTRGVTFGCFAETMALTAALKRGENIKDVDWFSVNKDNMHLVEKQFSLEGFTTPTPRCFGKTVKSFNLNLCEDRIRPQVAAKFDRPEASVAAE